MTKEYDDAYQASRTGGPAEAAIGAATVGAIHGEDIRRAGRATTVAEVMKRLERGNPYSPHYTDLQWACRELIRLHAEVVALEQQVERLRAEIDAEPMSDEVFR